MDSILEDLRFSLRTLGRSPGYVAVAAITLALAIGANTAIFSVLYGVLLRDLPFAATDRLVMVWDNYLRLGMERIPSTSSEFADYRAQNQVFSDIAAFRVRQSTLSGAAPRRVAVAAVSANLFHLLGVSPVEGRAFTAEEDREGHDNVALVSERFSREAKPAGNIVLDGRPYTIIGALPAGFQFPYSQPGTREPIDFYVPIAFPASELATRGGGYNTSVVARLKPGVSIEQAQADMDGIGRRLEAQYPRQYRGPGGADGGWRITVGPLAEQITGDVRKPLLALFGAVAALLLIACGNVANLSLARATGRRQEIVIRMALGAGRARIVRQFIVESLLVSSLGGAAGALLAMWGVNVLVAAAPADLPRLGDISIDRTALLFAAALSVFTGVAFGIAPVFTQSVSDLAGVLRERVDSGRGRLRSLLVVAEVALSVILLVGAGLLMRSFLRLMHVSAGFDPAQVMTMQIPLPAARYPQASQRALFYQRLMERVQALPGVVSASVTSSLPLGLNILMGPFSIEGRPYDPTGRPPVSSYQSVGDGYFHTMRIPLLRGRGFTARDDEKAPPVVVINQTMARTFFAGENPLGTRIKLGAPTAPRPWLTIVGVIGDVRYRGLDRQPTPQMYVPFPQETPTAMTVVARAAGDPAPLASAISAEVFSLDPDQPVTAIRTMEQQLADSVAQRRFQLFLVSLFAMLGLVLAAVGVYGVMSYLVRQRTREIGIRMALGAGRSSILRWVMGRGMGLVLGGAAVGLAGAFAVTRLLSTLLYEIRPTDAVTFAAAPVLLALVALIACHAPARRAMAVDPIRSIRHE